MHQQVVTYILCGLSKSPQLAMIFSVSILYTKSRTLYVTRFFKTFLKVGIYILKARHFALRDFFIYKKPDTSQQARQFTLCFIYKNPDTLRYAIFHWIFEIGGVGGGAFLGLNILFKLYFYMQKTMHFELRLYTKILTLCVTFLYAKEYALLVTFLYLKFIV